MPITGIAFCCARATSGQVAAPAQKGDEVPSLHEVLASPVRGKT
jgi:hypothetical protein